MTIDEKKFPERKILIPHENCLDASSAIWAAYSQDDMLIVSCGTAADRNWSPVFVEFRRVLELPVFTKSLFSQVCDVDKNSKK